MANAAGLAALSPVRALIVGYPGTAKTGALAPLIDAGYKIRMLDFDGNYESMLTYTKDKSKLVNVDIVTLEDGLRVGKQFVETKGTPNAFYRGLELMDEWKYTNPDGTVTNLGKSSDWGCDTIVVLDSMTAMGEAAKRRAMSLTNKTPMNMTDGTWGLAMKEQEAFIERLTSKTVRHHVIVISHLKLVGPNDVRKGEDDITKELKGRLVDLVPTRLFPSALGKALPPVIGGHFPTLIEAATVNLPGGRMKRMLRTVPRTDLDLKVPHPEITGDLEVSDGLLKLFEKLAPPLASCQSAA
jgi:hypothetical protein